MFTTPAPGFDDPLALLAACHERILRQCATLEKICAHLRIEGLTAEVRQAVSEVHRYFSTAVPDHHDDEEQDLFPLLRGDPPLASLIETLTDEHARLETLWRTLEPPLAEPEAIRDVEAFAGLVAEFNALYAAHIARENGELLPRAARLLSKEALAVLGARMAARRGVSH